MMKEKDQQGTKEGGWVHREGNSQPAVNGILIFVGKR